MGKFTKFCIGLLFILIVTGCIAEDYDVGVPSAYLYFEALPKQLTEANIYWSTAEEVVEKSIENVEEFALQQDEIKVYPNQKATLDFKENEENGGDIWTNPTITVALLKDGKRTEIVLDESRDIQFPAEVGNYVLQVNFRNLSGSAQYVGNIVVVNPNN